MNQLIHITERAVGASSIATVDARQLHAFLEVQTRFTDWLARRIEEYGFVEGTDYVEVLLKNEQNPEGGRPSKEYALTLDMAKELSMVERNDKGKQARQYFIECERRATTAGKASAAPSPLKQAGEAAKTFNAVFRTMRLIGCDKNAAAISANQTIRRVAGVDLLALSGNTHLAAANQTSLYYTPTEIGQQMGGLSAKKVNLLLAAAGLQARIGEHWQAMEAARDFVRILDTGKRHGSGSPIQQLKWSETVIPLLDKEALAA